MQIRKKSIYSIKYILNPKKISKIKKSGGPCYKQTGQSLAGYWVGITEGMHCRKVGVGNLLAKKMKLQCIFWY